MAVIATSAVGLVIVALLRGTRPPTPRLGSSRTSSPARPLESHPGWRGRRQPGSALVDASPASCTAPAVVDAYAPSAWEAAWRQQAGRLGTPNATVCSAMRQAANADKANKWISHLTECSRPGADCFSAVNASIFSQFYKSCFTAAGHRMQWAEPIEPLVGHMRHPRANPECVADGVAHVGIEDRAYLLPLAGGGRMSLAEKGYTGRKFLVDAGANMYGTGLAWLVDTYARAGIEFDQVYAWEASPISAPDYWETVPTDVAPRLHFINVPVSAEAGASMNPLTWIRAIYRPGDFIVFKLDIDNDEVEGALLSQIAGSPDLIGMVAEVFYEKHYREPAMAGYLGFDEHAGAYVDAVELLGDLRAKGLRIHYWP
jgi:hypothetical protein